MASRDDKKNYKQTKKQTKKQTNKKAKVKVSFKPQHRSKLTSRCLHLLEIALLVLITVVNQHQLNVIDGKLDSRHLSYSIVSHHITSPY